MSPRVERALKIDGWMSRDELEWLEENAAGKRCVVEFGSWCGRSSVALAAARSLACVDHWNGSKEHSSLMKRRDIRAEWAANTAEDADHVHGVRTDLGTAEGWALFLAPFRLAHDQADMVFIDASHDKESVMRNITQAMSILRPGGLLCGHDYGGSLWPGVTAAVDEMVANVQRGPSSIWFSREWV